MDSKKGILVEGSVVSGEVGDITLDMLNEMKKNIEAQKRKLVKEAKMAAAAEQLSELMEGFRDIIKQEDVSLVSSGSQGVFYRFDGDSTYVTQWTAFFHEIGVFDKEEKQGFLTELRRQGRVYKDVGCSYHDLGKHTLNLFNKDKIVEMQKKVSALADSDAELSYHPVFDYLFRSLGQESEEAYYHLIDWWLRKLYFPADASLPALCFHGEGGAGRNSMFEYFGVGVFGKKGSIKRFFDDFCGPNGRFDSDTLNAVVVMLDEKPEGNKHHNFLKGLVNNPNRNIEQKFGFKGTVPNILGVAIVTNHDTAVKLEGGKQDRRWSILGIKKSIDHFADIVGVERMRQEVGLPEGANKNNIILDWNVNIMLPLLTDSDEVSKFLAFHKRNRSVWQNRIVAYQGESYQEQLGSDFRSQDVIFEAVFDNLDFTHISSRTLYDLYVFYHKHFGGGSGMVKSQRAITLAAKQFVDKRGYKVKYSVQRLIPDPMFNKKRSNFPNPFEGHPANKSLSRCFVIEGASSQLKNNDADFVARDLDKFEVYNINLVSLN